MLSQPIHILTQTGVMTSFSIAKKLTETDIKNYVSKSKRKFKTSEEITKILQEKIINEIQQAITKNQVPGLISEQEIAKDQGLDADLVSKIPELSKLIIVIAQKLVGRKYDKMTMCYFINSLVNIIGLSEEDFTKFHQKNNTNKNPDDDDDDDYGDEEDED